MSVKTRLISGTLFFIVILLGLINKWTFLAVFSAFLLIQISEYLKIIRKKYQPQYWLTLIASASIFLTLFFAAEQKRIFLSFLAVDYLLIIILICLELLSTKNNKLENVSVSIFPLIYNAVGFSSLNFIAFWPKHHFNPYAILAFFAIIWATDISAFFFGSWLGKKPLAKNISPKKTIEGTIAGIAAGFITAIVESLLIKQFPLSLGIILGLLIPISGTIGDLLESAIKRQMQVKDSGSIMPGHGGLLDRFDSTTLAAALTALTLLFFAKL